MKKIFCIGCVIMTLLFATAMSAFAQEEVRVKNGNEDDPYMKNPGPDEKGFRKENLFTGGNVTASFSSGYTVLGLSPMLGYKLNDYVDAGIALNYVYTGARDVYDYDDKVRQHVFGPGIFARVYPVSMIFLQAQAEQNFVSSKYIPGSNSTFKPSTSTYGVPSLLLGGGYAGGRTKGGTTFYYISILADVLKNPKSPYVDVTYDPNSGAQRVKITPVIRAGFNIGLFQKRYGPYGRN